MSSTDQLLKTINHIITNPRYAPFLAILKSARNGAVYGAKIRFPHALVMVLLFRSGTIREKSHLITKATITHATNLAKFASIYKATCLILKKLNPNGKEGSFDTFLAGLLGGYLVFGQRSPRSGKISSVSQQIVIYVFARVVLALAKLSVRPGVGLVGKELREKLEWNAWPAFAALSWGGVMWLFRWYPDTVQSSLRSSMQYIYRDCDEWTDLRTLVWHNK